MQITKKIGHGKIKEKGFSLFTFKLTSSIIENLI